LCEQKTFTIFNRLAVPERWNAELQREIQEDIFETVLLKTGAEEYEQAVIGQRPQYSRTWAGETVTFGPVNVIEWPHDQGRAVSVQEAMIHNKQQLGKVYEFLIEMLLVTSSSEWRLSSMPNFPHLLSLVESET
jgi:hypothetical protein